MLDGSFSKLPDGGHIISFDRFVERPIAKVWAALTEPEILKNWLGNVEVEPKLGGKYVIHFRETSVVMSGAICAFEPERLLEYTWLENFGMPQSVVRWEMLSEETGCRLRLTHTFPPEAVLTNLIGFLGGWHDFLDSLPRASDGDFMPYGAKPSEKELDAQYRAKYLAAFNEDAISLRLPGVQFERLLPRPIERVWQHLTVTKLLPSWFGSGSIEPRMGGAVTFMDGHIRGVVTRWDPPICLAYTWNVHAPDDAANAISAYPESYLNFNLEPQGGQVLLRLRHLPILERFEKQNAMGWHTFLDMLGATLRGEKVEERAVYMKKNAALYGVDLANLAR